MARLGYHENQGNRDCCVVFGCVASRLALSSARIITQSKARRESRIFARFTHRTTTEKPNATFPYALGFDASVTHGSVPFVLLLFV